MPSRQRPSGRSRRGRNILSGFASRAVDNSCRRCKNDGLQAAVCGHRIAEPARKPGPGWILAHRGKRPWMTLPAGRSRRSQGTGGRGTPDPLEDPGGNSRGAAGDCLARRARRARHRGAAAAPGARPARPAAGIRPTALPRRPDRRRPPPAPDRDGPQGAAAFPRAGAAGR